MTPPMTVVRVAVDVPGAPGERLYDYLSGDVAPVTIGDGVIVPFGGRRAIGIVVSLDPTDLPPAGITLKPVEGRLGSAPLVTPLLMSLAESIATRWAAPIATTSSGFTPLDGSRLKYPLTTSVTFGIRVMPPTITTSSISSLRVQFESVARKQGDKTQAGPSFQCRVANHWCGC